MEVRLAIPEDICSYAALGRAAQERLRARGLEQYVPAGHNEYAAAIRERVESATLYAVCADGDGVGFFSLDPTPSP